MFGFAVCDDGREITGAVAVYLSIEVQTIELSKLQGVLLRDVHVAVEFADNRAILAFDQAVIVAVSRTGFGKFYSQLFQQFCHGIVDVFAAIIRMKAWYLKGEDGQYLCCKAGVIKGSLMRSSVITTWN